MRVALRPPFAIRDDEALALERVAPLAKMYVLSPFVWREGDRRRILVRAVPKRRDPRRKISSIYYGEGVGGLHFRMDEEPVLAAGEGDDAGGCEDPTVVAHDGRYVVFYSGWSEERCESTLLAAVGASARRLEKTGRVPLEGGFANCKEASVFSCDDGTPVLFFEYASGEHSLIGMARSASLDGPWRPERSPLTTRYGYWDSWHLSTGPIVATSRGPVMFYNGADEAGTWRVGWVAFDPAFTRCTARCGDPLFVPPPPKAGMRDVAFAASAVEADGAIHLYYTLSDAYLRRAIVLPEGAR